MTEKNMSQRVRMICLGILLAVGLIACDDAGRAQHQPTSNKKERVARRRSAPAKSEDSSMLSGALIPKDVAYTIIDTNVIPGVKRSLDVRLNRKVEKDVLRSIATELKEDDPKRYERTFIVFYLPEMKVGAGGWATAHFDPNLEINIFGLTPKQEAALSTGPRDATREVIGSWLDQTPMVSGKITIFRKGGKVYMERKFKDGSGSSKEMVEKPSSIGKRFEEKGGTRFGDHYVIDRQGNLQIRDREGLISTAKRTK